MKKIILSALVGLALSSGVASANPERSDYWLEKCEADSFSCYSYMLGVSQSNRFTKTAFIKYSKAVPSKSEESLKTSQMVEVGIFGCSPDTVTIGQMIKIWVKHLKEHPEHHHHFPAVTFSNAMHKAFPCE